MLPILQIGPLSLPTYPFAILLALWAGLALGARVLSARSSLDGDHIWNAGSYGVVAMIVIGRLSHVIAFWSAYRLQPLEIIGLNAQAFLWGPGLIAGCATAVWYIWRHRLPWPTLLDALAAGATAGLMIANLGALLAGQANGAPSELPWAIESWGVRRHPVQLYAAPGGAITLLALWLLRRWARPGMVALLALLGWGLTTWLVEPFRAASVALSILGGVRVVQAVGLAAAVGALWMLRRPPQAPTPAPDRETTVSRRWTGR